MPSKKLTLVPGGRLAIRTEGKFVNGYYARPDTMEGAVPLFSVRRACTNYEAVHAKVFELGQAIVACLLLDTLGDDAKIAWLDPTQAPEHERSGNA